MVQVDVDQATPPRGFVPARVIAGRYRLIERIGAGGMGTVFRAEQLGLGRDVAIKVIGNGRGAVDDDSAARFAREAQLLARLAHPAIVTVFDFDFDDGTPFLAMEHIGGESLAARIRRGALDESAAIDVGVAIADALAAAHDAGILHRDLKPQNVMLTTSTSTPVKLIDFGLARLAAATASAYVMGTPGYIAPEYALTGVVTAAADHHALGLVLAEAVLGAHPYLGGVVGVDVVAARVGAAGAPRLAPIVAALLAPDPRARLAAPLAALVALQTPGEPSPPGLLSPREAGEEGLFSPRRPHPQPSASGEGEDAGEEGLFSPRRPHPQPLSMNGEGSALPASTTVGGAAGRASLPAWAVRPRVDVDGGLVDLVAAGRLVTVRVLSFAIDRFPVTNREYAAFAQASGRATPSWWGGRVPPREHSSCPVVGVDVDDAAAFARASGGRLPTEAEWAWAACGAQLRAFPWGDVWEPGRAHAHHEDPHPRRRPGPIGLFSPIGDNARGLADLGAVWEWTSTREANGCVVRGGPWRDRMEPAALMNRSYEDRAAVDVGFRCVYDASPGAR